MIPHSRPRTVIQVLQNITTISPELKQMADKLPADFRQMGVVRADRSKLRAALFDEHNQLVEQLIAERGEEAADQAIKNMENEPRINRIRFLLEVVLKIDLAASELQGILS